MFESNELSIYAVETPVQSNNEEDGVSYHSFLLLAENVGGKLKPYQELHFVYSERPDKSGGLKKIPCLKAVTKPANRNYSEMVFSEFIKDDRETVLSQWNKIIDVSGTISGLKIAFTKGAGEEKAINCRTGTRAVLEILGCDFKPFVDGAVSGSKVSILDQLPNDVIITDATPRFISPDILKRLRISELNL